MDAGLSPHLEALLLSHPGVTIDITSETLEWEAVQRPTPTCVIVNHAPTLAELGVKLDGGTP